MTLQYATILFLLSFYTILVVSADLTSGMANLLAFCQAAFCGIGAYLSAFFLINCHLPFLLVALAVMLATGLCGILVSLASMRLKGDYFVLATLAFQIIVFVVFYNWTSVTGGDEGTPSFDRIQLFFGKLALSDGAFALLSLCLAILSVLLVAALQRSPFGRLLRAIRADEKAVEALGHNVSVLKIRAFFISAALSGLAGLLYAAFHGYVEPTAFTISDSLLIITALFLGGTGNWRGPVLGAFVIVLLPEILRGIGLEQEMVNNLKQVIYGLLLVGIMFFRPQGLLGEKTMGGK